MKWLPSSAAGETGLQFQSVAMETWDGMKLRDASSDFTIHVLASSHLESWKITIVFTLVCISYVSAYTCSYYLQALAHSRQSLPHEPFPDAVKCLLSSHVSSSCVNMACMKSPSSVCSIVAHLPAVENIICLHGSFDKVLHIKKFDVNDGELYYRRKCNGEV